MLNWLRTWQLGVKSLLVHPLRSLLTVLGIFIGVASVIWLLAIGEGISIKAQQQIEELGANNIIVRSVKPSTLDENSMPKYGVTREDYEALTETVPSIESALRIRELTRRAEYDTSSFDVRMVGCTPEYADVMRLAVDRGHFISTVELDNATNVCALSAEVARRLFPIGDPLGKAIRLENQPFLVVGVMKPRDAMAGIGGSLAAQEFNSDVYVPITSLWKQYTDLITVQRAGSFLGEEVQLSQLTIRVRKMSQVHDTTNIVRNMLTKRHQHDDFSIVVPQELLEQAKTTRLMFILLMGLIAAISLVVGGIGIMNIMLATVTERTREIGIRRALGAKRADITRQFLIETVALSVVGGVTGILGGLTCPWVIGWVRGGLETALPEAMQNLPPMVRTAGPVIVPWSIPLAFGISVAVGVVFGLYPAIRAASMDPIEALRHE